MFRQVLSFLTCRDTLYTGDIRINYLSVKQLSSLYTKADKRVLKYLADPTWYELYEINTPERYFHFLSQMAHESMGFSRLREIRSNASAEAKYGAHTRIGRVLGNKYKGDGAVYKGRGIVQLTGRWNHKYFSARLTKSLGRKTDILANPRLLEQPKIGTIIAFEFWSSKRLNTTADIDNIEDRHRAITKKINGGFNGLADRKKKYEEIKDHYSKFY